MGLREGVRGVSLPPPPMLHMSAVTAMLSPLDARASRSTLASSSAMTSALGAEPARYRAKLSCKLYNPAPHTAVCTENVSTY